ncbi:MAG TPA: universal stress protein [Chthoniobacterales bacterium]
MTAPPKIIATKGALTDEVFLRKIVVAVDLSPHSGATAQYAAEIARSFGASLVLVHVYPVEQVNDFAGATGYEADERQRQAAERALQDLTETLRESGQECESVFLIGQPAAQVSAVASELGADLIVTAIHHPSVLGQLFKWDQAPRIVHRAPCSVLVYHDAEGSPGGTLARPEAARRLILAPVDLIAESAPALEFAVTLACRWDADLYVLHVFSTPESAASSHYPHEVQGVEGYRQARSAKLQEWVSRLQSRHPRTYPLFEADQSPVDCIQQTSRQLRADLIVISAHNAQSGWSWFLPVSDVDGITRRAGQPVLVFRRRETPGASR